MGEPRAARLVEAVLRCYPARWRRRHGEEAAELAALLIRDGTPAGSIAWSLAGVYAGLVLLATQVFRVHAPVAVAAATLAAAALFAPVRAGRLHQTAHMRGAAAVSNDISNLPLERQRRETRTCRSKAICRPDLTSGPVLPKRGALAKLRYSPS